MLDDCENHSASCCEIRLEPSPILTKVSAAGVGTTPGEGPETQRTHCRPGEGASRRPEEDRRARKADHGTRKANHRTRKANHRLRSEEHTSELQSPDHLVCRLLLEKKKKKK